MPSFRHRAILPWRYCFNFCVTVRAGPKTFEGGDKPKVEELGGNGSPNHVANGGVVEGDGRLVNISNQSGTIIVIEPSARDEAIVGVPAPGKVLFERALEVALCGDVLPTEAIKGSLGIS